MRARIIGAGPAGLYLALLLKRRRPCEKVVVIEQNERDATYGFGVVFSTTARRRLEAGDETVYRRLKPWMERWDDLTIVHRDERVAIDGNGFAAIGRLKLSQLLYELCDEAGVELRFGCREDRREGLADADLVVGADGINSSVREEAVNAFRPRIRWLTNRYVWYGTARRFDTLTLTFRTNEDGAFVAHHYRYDLGMSTFIVECDALTWARAGLGDMSDERSRAYCEGVFAPDLGGHGLISNHSAWQQFPVLTNRSWSIGNRILIGDALRSVHFSIGSGTRWQWRTRSRLPLPSMTPTPTSPAPSPSSRHAGAPRSRSSCPRRPGATSGTSPFTSAWGSTPIPSPTTT